MDGTAQLNSPVGVQELEELRGLATRRFSTGERGVEQSLAFRRGLGQATTGSRSESFAFFLQQRLLVSGIQLPSTMFNATALLQ